jgi:hypothetical protein
MVWLAESVQQPEIQWSERRYKGAGGTDCAGNVMIGAGRDGMMRTLMGGGRFAVSRRNWPRLRGALAMKLLHDVFAVLSKAKEPYEASYPPLHDAALDGNVRRVGRLIHHGADVNARSSRAFTALHWAVHSGSSEVLALLIENGAQVDARDDEGETPLHHAAENADDRLATVLLDHGADVNARDHRGRTPLAIATDSRYPETRTLLLLRSRQKVADLLRERGGVD